ncbi:MAG: spermidine synthase [Myxococcota bacterium]
MSISNIDFLDAQETPIGMICLRRRELLAEPGTVVTEITLDHQLLMSSHHTASERALSSLALDRHPGQGLDVLIGGLGLGYTATEVLRCERVASVEVVEFLPQVIGWTRDGLIPESEKLNDEPRLRIVEGDVYALLAAPPQRRFDLVLIDVDHSPEERLGETNAGFYTRAGLESARRHLAPGGLLGVWSYAESSPFVEALHEVFARVEVESSTFHNHLTEESETNWLFFAGEA